jgi:hypothetical protein
VKGGQLLQTGYSWPCSKLRDTCYNADPECVFILSYKYYMKYVIRQALYMCYDTSLKVLLHNLVGIKFPALCAIPSLLYERSPVVPVCQAWLSWAT